MSVLKKIRENVGLVIVIIALSLFAFIFSSVFKNPSPGQDNSIGEVSGQELEYQAFEQKFEQYQRNNPEATTTAEQYRLKEQAWQNMVQGLFLAKEWESAGIGLSGTEQRMMLDGLIPTPSVQQSGYFGDSVSRYNPANVSRVLQTFAEIDINDRNTDPRYVEWKIGFANFLDGISLERCNNKWIAAVKGSALVSDNEVKWTYEQQQRAADINYLFVPYASIPNEQVTVTDADRNDYYNKHREAYRMPEELARIKYTYFKITPSSRDSAKTREDLVKLIPEFRASTQPFQFVSSASDDRVIDSTPKPLGQLPAALIAIGGRTDTVIGPSMSANGMQIMRVVKMTEDTANAYVDLRHIMITIGTDSAKADAKVDSLLMILKADSSKFAELALMNSDDQDSKINGGSLGTRPQNNFSEKFGEDLKKAEPGTIYRTSSPGNYHIVQLKSRSNRTYTFATINRVITSSTETNDSVFKRASLFHGDVLGGADMDSASRKYAEARTLSSGNITPGTYNLFGVLAGRPVIAWAFNSEEGAISQKLIEAEDAFVVAKVEYKGSRGYSTMESLKANPEFELAVLNSLKAKQIKAKLGNGGTDLQSMAAAYGPGATSGEAKDLHLSASEVPGLGIEPKVVGRAFGLQTNAVSAPMAGNAGVYVVKLIAVREPAPMQDFMKQFTVQSMKATKADGAVNALFQGLRENADIIDTRYKAEREL